MAVNTVASSTAVAQATPARQPQPVQANQQPDQVTQPPPPPQQQQQQVAPSVNTNGQQIGTTISTSA